MTATDLRREIKALRATLWAGRTERDKQNGTGWVCLDYATMNRIEELQSQLDALLDAERSARQAAFAYPRNA